MALPKYKEAKAIIEKTVSRRFRDISRAEMVPFNQSPSLVQHEGRTLVHNTLNDQSSEKILNYQTASVEYKFDRSNIPDMTPEEMIAIIDEKAKDMGSQMAKYQFEVLNQTVQETGNSVDAKGQKLSPELFLETMSKISISFDEQGKPKLPTIVIGSNSVDEWKRVMAEAEADPSHKDRFDAIIAKKKEDFDAEQARRKLVD